MTILTTENFHVRAGETFELSLGETSMTLTLTEVRALEQRVFAGQIRQPFSLIFRSTSPVALPQRIYTLTNSAMGKADIFLVPIARDAHGMSYQAIFN